MTPDDEAFVEKMKAETSGVNFYLKRNRLFSILDSQRARLAVAEGIFAQMRHNRCSESHCEEMAPHCYAGCNLCAWEAAKRRGT